MSAPVPDYIAVLNTGASTLMAQTIQEHRASMVFPAPVQCLCGWRPDVLVAVLEDKGPIVQHAEHVTRAIIAVLAARDLLLIRVLEPAENVPAASREDLAFEGSTGLVYAEPNGKVLSDLITPMDETTYTALDAWEDGRALLSAATYSMHMHQIQDPGT